MPSNDYLIIILAVATLCIVLGAAAVLRRQVAKSKKDPRHSSFTEHHGEAPRPNRPGTEH